MDSGGPRSHARVSPSRLSNCMNQEKWPKTANFRSREKITKEKNHESSKPGHLFEEGGSEGQQEVHECGGSGQPDLNFGGIRVQTVQDGLEDGLETILKAVDLLNRTKKLL